MPGQDSKPGEKKVRALVIAAALYLTTSAAMAAGFTVTSRNIQEGETVPVAQVFNGSGCRGNNRSPQLSWSGAPAGTKSFAVTMFDPDAPTGNGWWHWTVFNIPPGVHSLPENAGGASAPGLPPGAVQARTSFGFSHYGGPCPPVGDAPHRYVVTVYALKVARVPLDARAPGAKVAEALRADALASAQLTGHYGR